MAGRDRQHWRCYPKSPGAPQHVPQDGLGLSALPCLEVAAHRSIGVAVPLGQHRSTLLSVPLAWGETRSDSHCLALGEQLKHQALPILSRDDFANRTPHQTIHAGKRGDHDELFPHVEEDIGARPGLESRRKKRLGDCLYTGIDPRSARQS